MSNIIHRTEANGLAVNVPPKMTIPQWVELVLKTGEPVLRKMGPVSLKKFLWDGMGCCLPVVFPVVHRRIIPYLKEGGDLRHWVEEKLLIHDGNVTMKKLGLERASSRRQIDLALPERVPELEDRMAVIQADARLPERVKRQQMALLRSEQASINRRGTLGRAEMRTDLTGDIIDRQVSESEAVLNRSKLDDLEKIVKAQQQTIDLLMAERLGRQTFQEDQSKKSQ